MINFKDIPCNYLRVTFENEAGVKHTVRGRVAQSICWLVERQQNGITAAEMSNWALRLGAYVHILRHKHHVNIRTDMEPHEGGSHGRYVLVSSITILSVEDLRKK